MAELLAAAFENAFRIVHLSTRIKSKIDVLRAGGGGKGPPPQAQRMVLRA